MKLELLVHGDHAVVKVYTSPGQSQCLALPQAKEQRGQKEILKGMSLNPPDKSGHIVLFQRLDLCFLPSRQGAGIGWICSNIAIENRLLQRLMQYAVDVLDGLCRQARSVRLIRRQRVIEGLHGVGHEIFHPDCPQCGLDMYPNVALVNLPCARLAGTQVVFHPDVQPLSQRHPARLLICTAVDLHGQRLQLFPHLFLRLAGNRTLLLPTGSGIVARGDACLPIGIILPVPCDGLLPNRAAAVGSSFVVCHISPPKSCVW